MSNAAIRLLSRRSTVRTIYALLTILIIVFYFETDYQAHRPGGIDLNGYLDASRHLLEGRNPYHVPDALFPFIYPLTLALLMVPLTLVPYGLALLVWYGVAVASLVGIVRIVGRFSDAEPWRWSVCLLVVLGFLDPIQNNLMNGQVNAIVLFLTLFFFDRYQRGQRLAAGSALGLAIAIKIMPAVLLMFLVLRREFRTLLIVAGVTALLLLAPAIVAGDHIFDFYTSYVNEFLLAPAKLPADGQPISFALDGVVRALAPDLGALDLVRYGALGLVVLLLAGFDAVRSSDVDPARFAAYLLAIPLLSPVSEIHHLIFVVPAAVLVTIAAVERDSIVIRLITAGFWVFLWTARGWRTSPLYFFCLLALAAGLLLTSGLSTRREASASGAMPAVS